MKNFFKLVQVSICIFFISASQGQMLMTDADFDQSNPLDCAGIVSAGTNFDDAAGNYPSNFNDTLVLCPDLAQGSKVSITFANSGVFEWDVHSTDTIYVFDGPDVTAPLLGAYNSDTDPLGFYVQASFDNNPSGCLTLVFVSDGASEGTGWKANVACGNPAQPIIPHIEGYINDNTVNDLTPADTGYIDVCLGDSILLKATPEFLYSLENTGTGYSQNNTNVTYEWTISGFGQLTGDSVWFTPPNRTGYYVELRTTDMFPQFEVISCRVRVSQLPSFAGAGPLEDTVCLGENTSLVGGVTISDTAGVDIPGGSFQVGGSFAGLTALPDGNGASYSTTIPITGFGASDTVTDFTDFDSLLISIEHSYTGDLDVVLTCPDGTSAIIFDWFGSGTPSTFLGNDTDIAGGAPGTPQWDYVWSEQYSNAGTIMTGAQIPNVNGFSAVDPNAVYTPQVSFDAFIGCPLNGNWTITVTDNIGADDGYIFEWAIFFNSSLYPDSEGYQNYTVDDFWTDDPTIVGGQNDTALVVNPTSPGEYFYTFNVEDDFGCTYDTTVTLNVLSLPGIFADTIGCSGSFQVTNTQSFAGGIWSSADTSVHFVSPNSDNPFIWTSNEGATYPITFTDNACNQSVTSNIYFPPYAYTDIWDFELCEGSTQMMIADDNPTWDNITWSTGSTADQIEISEAGWYSVTVDNVCHSYTDSAYITTKFCNVSAPNVITPNGDGANDLFFVNHEGLKDFTCRIHNRWGNLIYEYSDPNGAWDGNNKNGKPVNEGTYFYYVDAVSEGGVDISIHGFVQVVHE